MAKVQTDPQTATFQVVLSRHQSATADRRPTFTFQTLTRRDAKQVAALVERLKSLDEGDGDDEADAIMDEAERLLGGLIRGWKHQRAMDGRLVAFDPRKLDSVLTEADLIELVYRLRGESSLGSVTRKKSASPSRSKRGRRASNAGPGGASTRRRQGSR